LILVIRILYNVLIYRQKHEISNPSSDKTLQISSTKINALSSQPTPTLNINNNNDNLLLDESLHKQLRLWLEREETNGYQNISEACRIAFNNSLLSQNVSN
jgi:hypothetical protein